MNSKNRRKHRRVRAAGVSVKVKISDVSSLLMVGNVSLGGLYVRTASPLPVGSPVNLEITGPTTRTPIKIGAKVVNVVSSRDTRITGVAEGMGLRFDESNDFEIKRIEEMVGKLASGTNLNADDAVRPTVTVAQSEKTRSGDPFSRDPSVQKAAFREKKDVVSSVAPAPAPAMPSPASPPLLRAQIGKALADPAAVAQPAKPSAPSLASTPAGDSKAELRAILIQKDQELIRLREENARLKSQRL